MGKEFICNAGDTGEPIGSLGQEDPLEEKMETRSSFLAGKSYGQRSLVGCSLWGHKEPATTEQSTAAAISHSGSKTV